jgi:hypothetical protein
MIQVQAAPYKNKMECVMSEQLGNASSRFATLPMC